MDQNLMQYKIFHTVAKIGNISKAANALYISQPAISKSIKKLEESLNVTLFIRNFRGVTLTEEGRLLFNHLELAFQTIEEGENSLKQKVELGIGHITIGVSSTLCKYILLPYLKEFIKENPHIQITIECHSTAHTLELLDQNKIDVGLIGSTKQISSSNFHYLREINYTFAANKSYLDNLTIRNITSEKSIFQNGNIMLLDKDNISRQHIDNYLNEHHLSISNPLEVNNIDLIVDFAKIGMGIGCVIKEFIQNDLMLGQLTEIPLSAPIPSRKIGFLFNKTKIKSNVIQQFMNLL